MTTVYLNGEFLPLEKAQVSVLDRGFLFADGVYEVVPVFNGHLFRLNEHLKRLQNSLNRINIEFTIDVKAWRAVFQQLIEQYKGQDQSVYLQITRGTDSHRDHGYNASLTPTLFAMTTPHTYKTYEQLKSGVSCITLPDQRWSLCDIKSLNLLPNILSYNHALQQGNTEAILIRDGFAIEGSSSNIFLVKNGTLITPPLSPFMLGGITRELILELARENQIPTREEWIPCNELASADELWLTSSKKEILTVSQLDGKPMSSSRTVFDKMIKHYYDYKKQLQDGKYDG